MCLLGFPAKTHKLVVNFTVTCDFDCDVFASAVFAVNLMNCPADELIQKADSSLRYVVSVRYDIIDFTHVVQVFDEADIVSVRHFQIELLYGTQCLQGDHLAHELDVLGGDRLGEQFTFVTILSV